MRLRGIVWLALWCSQPTRWKSVDEQRGLDQKKEECSTKSFEFGLGSLVVNESSATSEQAIQDRQGYLSRGLVVCDPSWSLGVLSLGLGLYQSLR